jgi:hypothetical protein
MAPLLAATERDQAAIDQVVARYQLEIDFTTIPILAEQHNRAWDSRTNRQGARCGTARDHDDALRNLRPAPQERQAQPDPVAI